MKTSILTLLLLCAAVLPARAADVPAATPTPTEAQLLDALKAPGVTTVVHFWAPWCPNCRAELGAVGGWGEFIRAHPETRFVFVTVWHEGKDGREALEKAGVAGQPNVTLLADTNASRGEDRTRRFLDLPMTWIPTTWVFRENKLRYALNYGEVRFPMLGQMVEDTGASWSHK